jgi:hypothetical protein
MGQTCQCCHCEQSEHIEPINISGGNGFRRIYYLCPECSRALMKAIEGDIERGLGQRYTVQT